MKYVLGGGYEKEIDPAIVSPFETLDRGGRKRRGRDFLMERADNVVKKVKQAMQKNKPNRTNDIGGKETQLSTTAKKTKEPDQSTSPSTPITPEHPSVSKSTTFKKGTISVPSFVIADRAVEVSPLQVDRAVAEAKKSTVARRGLFGCGTSSNNRETNTQSKVQKTIKAAKASIAPNGSDSAARDCAFHQSSQSVTKAHSAAVKNSLMMKQGRGMSAKLGGKKTTMANRKPAATAGGAARKTTKASLKGVFDYERRKAREFLDEVCRAPCHDMEVDDPASKENRLNTSASESEEERKPSA